MVHLRETVIVRQLECVAQEALTGARSHAPMELHRQRHATGSQQRAVEVKIRCDEGVRPRRACSIALDGEQRQHLVIWDGARLPRDGGCASRALGLELSQQPARFLWCGSPDRHAEHPRAASRRRHEGPDPTAALDQPELPQAVHRHPQRGDRHAEVRGEHTNRREALSRADRAAADDLPQ
jgi:hypothetical protein